MDRSTKQKINKETETLNDSMNQLDIIDNYRRFHPKTFSFNFSSSAHRTFSRIELILAINPALINSKQFEIIPVIFSDYSAVRLDLNYRGKKIKKKKYNIWTLDNTLRNSHKIMEEIKKEIKICIGMNENKNTTTQNL